MILEKFSLPPIIWIKKAVTPMMPLEERATQTNPFGKSASYTYDLNSRVTEVDVDGEGITSYTYDWVGRLTEKDDPVKGTINYTYNVRGDLLSDEQGSYSYDILGRVTSHPTEGSFTYTPDGHIATHNGKDYEFNTNGNLTSWESDGGTIGFSYTGLQGSTRLGLPSSMTGWQLIYQLLCLQLYSSSLTQQSYCLF
jgi:YD repeat-containing protein